MGKSLTDKIPKGEETCSKNYVRLCATVFTEDIAKANRVARKIRAGTGKNFQNFELFHETIFSLGKHLAKA